MQIRCQKTCGYCPSICSDKFTFCKKLKIACNIIEYIPLMLYSCPSTCNFCGIENLLCQDNAYDCISEIKKCRLPGYENVMEQRCAKTCGFC